MRSTTAAAAAILWVILASACASHPEPIIDMLGVDESALAADWSDCDRYRARYRRGRADWAKIGCLLPKSAPTNDH